MKLSFALTAEALVRALKVKAHAVADRREARYDRIAGRTLERGSGKPRAGEGMKNERRS